jgi:hypothetical protein
MALILDGTNGLSDVDGSAATPAIRGSDANTGVFFGTDIVGVSTGGSERMRVDASGNVGIGTSSPDTVSGYIVVDVRGSTNGGFLQVGNGTVKNTMYQSSSVGFVGTQTNHALGFVTDGNERMRIDTSGNLLVGTTTFASGQNGVNIRGSSGGFTDEVLQSRTAGTGSTLNTGFYNDNGRVGTINTSGSSTSYNTSSDYRLKHDIQPMSGALAKVTQLKPVTYKWNIDDSQSQGFIAHELQEVVPECVTGEKDAVDAEGNPQYQGIDTSFLVATLAAAIQELKGINDAQAQIITALTARVEALEGAQA